MPEGVEVGGFCVATAPHAGERRRFKAVLLGVRSSGVPLHVKFVGTEAGEPFTQLSAPSTATTFLFASQVSAWTPPEQRPGAAAASPSSAAENRKLRVRSSASGLVLPRTGVPAGPAAGAAGAEGWLSGGPHVGQRLLRRLEGHGDIGAVVRLYLPPGEAEDEPALWRIEHDDGDGEDLEENELLEAIARRKGRLRTPSHVSRAPPPL
uniref:Uncharacterized protein n=1 Tax=Emiliania huxleyi TaxID=2903 RepID=A0A7S3X0N9_EMIHU